MTGDERTGEEWVTATLAELTLDEKAALTAGRDAWTTVPIERLGVPSMKVTDGPNGARGDGVSGATAVCFPVGSALGATWNVDLLHEVGVALAREAATKGAQVLLGPTVNIHRSPLGGRNFECYSEDPLLTAHLATALIEGLQSEGVGACIKHYAGNESEFERMTISSVIPERALREIYLLPFEHAVAHAKPWSVMAAYNRVDGVYASAHPRLLRSILQDEWGFNGLVISDWGAVHDTVGTAMGGCHLEMPGPATHLGPRLADAVRRDEVAVDVLDDMARRVLRTVARSGRVERPAEVEESSDDRPEDRELARRASTESMVLLKNDGVLPLDVATLRRVPVVGPNAEHASIMGGGSSIVRAHHQVHPFAALRDRLGESVAVDHHPGGSIDRFVPDPQPRWFESLDDGGRGLRVRFTDGEQSFGERLVRKVSWVWWVPPADAPRPTGWRATWTGTFAPDTSGDWTFGLACVGRARVLLDGEVVCDDWTAPEPGVLLFGSGTTEVRSTAKLEAGRRYELVIEYESDERSDRGAIRFGIAPPVPEDPVAAAAALAGAADAAIVVVGTNGDWETEGSDRESMRLPGRQDELVRAVAAANPRTVVVLNTGSPVEMPWLDDAAAVVQAWFGGQEFGDALAAVLTGDADAGGRLPTTFPRRYVDHPALFNYPGENGEVHYGEGLFVGYRGYDARAVEPLFCFGHGLSYATFAMAAPAVEQSGHDVRIDVAVTNTSNRAGSTVVQAYVRPRRSRPARPERELKAFAKLQLDAGATATARLHLDERSFAYYDPSVPAWVAEPGAYDVDLGWSSRDIVQTVAITL